MFRISKTSSGRCPLDPLALHVLVHVKNKPTKRSEYEHLEKVPWCLNMHQKIISNCWNLENLLKEMPPDPLAILVHVLLHIKDTNKKITVEAH